MDHVLTFDDTAKFKRSQRRIVWTTLPCGCSVSNRLALMDESHVRVVSRCMEHRHAHHLTLLAMVKQADQLAARRAADERENL